MTQQNISAPREGEIPRWTQVLAGVILGLLTLLLVFVSAALLIDIYGKRPFVALAVGLIFLTVFVWLFEKCWRLLTHRKNKGGLLSPNALRIVSLFCLIFPVAGVFTGYYKKMGPLAILQAVIYLFAFLGLRALANKRQADSMADEQKNDRNH